ADTQVDGAVRALPGDPEPLGSPGRGIHPAGATAPAADRVRGGGQPDRGRGDLRGPRFLRRIVAAVVGDVPPLLADNPRGDAVLPPGPPDRADAGARRGSGRLVHPP